MDPHARKTYYGSRLGFREQPDLTAFTQCHTVLLDRNEIRVLYRELFPPNPTKLSLSKNEILTDGLCREWPNTVEHLELDDNHIRDLTFVDHWPTHLRTLVLDTNPLEYCHLQISSLEELSLSYTNIRRLDVFPPNLKILKAFYSRLTTFGKLPATLEYCNLAYNQLTSYNVFFSPMPTQLKYLNLSGNMLKSIPGNLPDSIETLILSKNQLSELPATLPANLLQLEVGQNRIRTFQLSWKPGQRIQQLGLRDNCLTNSEASLLASGRVVRVQMLENWNEEIHTFSARCIQRNYRISKLRRILRQRARLHKVKQELFEVAYSPDIIGRWNIPDGWANWQHKN